MAKIKQFEAFTKIFVAYKKNWVYSTMTTRDMKRLIILLRLVSKKCFLLSHNSTFF